MVLTLTGWPLRTLPPRPGFHRVPGHSYTRSSLTSRPWPQFRRRNKASFILCFSSFYANSFYCVYLSYFRERNINSLQFTTPLWQQREDWKKKERQFLFSVCTLQIRSLSEIVKCIFCETFSSNWTNFNIQIVTQLKLLCVECLIADCTSNKTTVRITVLLICKSLWHYTFF